MLHTCLGAENQIVSVQLSPWTIKVLQKNRVKLVTGNSHIIITSPPLQSVCSHTWDKIRMSIYQWPEKCPSFQDNFSLNLIAVYSLLKSNNNDLYIRMWDAHFLKFIGRSGFQSWQSYRAVKGDAINFSFTFQQDYQLHTPIPIRGVLSNGEGIGRASWYLECFWICLKKEKELCRNQILYSQCFVDLDCFQKRHITTHIYAVNHFSSHGLINSFKFHLSIRRFAKMYLRRHSPAAITFMSQ